MSTLLRFELTHIRELSEQFDASTVDKALKRTLDRMQDRAALIVSKDVRSFYNVSAARVKKDLALKTVTVGGKPGRLLLYVGQKVGLTRFAGSVRTVAVDATRKSSGKKFKTHRKAAYSKPFKSGARERSRTRNGAWGFPATGKNFNFHFFARDRDPKKIDTVLKGPSIPEMVNSNTFRKLNAILEQDMPREFNSHMNFYLGQKVGLY